MLAKPQGVGVVVRRRGSVSNCRGGVSASRPAPLSLGRKPSYHPLPRGTTFLFDTANLIGGLGVEQVGYRLEVIAEALTERGYRPMFFWERRALRWAKEQQVHASDRVALAAFAQRKEVTLVDDEADLVLLQMLHEFAESVCVTRDRMQDYAEVYPDLVGSSRFRSFSSVKLGNRCLLTIVGLAEAISIPEAENEEPPPEPAVVLAPPVSVEPAAAEGLPPVNVGKRRGLAVVAERCLAKGEMEKALSLYSRVARKHPRTYLEMSDLYDGTRGLPADARSAAKYAELAFRREKMRRECKRRQLRQRAEARRERELARICGFRPDPHPALAHAA